MSRKLDRLGPAATQQPRAGVGRSRTSKFTPEMAGGSSKVSPRLTADHGPVSTQEDAGQRPPLTRPSTTPGQLALELEEAGPTGSSTRAEAPVLLVGARTARRDLAARISARPAPSPVLRAPRARCILCLKPLRAGEVQVHSGDSSCGRELEQDLARGLQLVQVAAEPRPTPPQVERVGAERFDDDEALCAFIDQERTAAEERFAESYLACPRPGCSGTRRVGDFEPGDTCAECGAEFSLEGA